MITKPDDGKYSRTVQYIRDEIPWAGKLYDGIGTRANRYRDLAGQTAEYIGDEARHRATQLANFGRSTLNHIVPRLPDSEFRRFVYNGLTTDYPDLEGLQYHDLAKSLGLFFPHSNARARAKVHKDLVKKIVEADSVSASTKIADIAYLASVTNLAESQPLLIVNKIKSLFQEKLSTIHNPKLMKQLEGPNDLEHRINQVLKGNKEAAISLIKICFETFQYDDEHMAIGIIDQTSYFNIINGIATIATNPKSADTESPAFSTLEMWQELEASAKAARERVTMNQANYRVA